MAEKQHAAVTDISDDAVRQATEALDLLGTVTAHGATIAPDYVMRSVIAMRSRLARHKPWMQTCSHPTCMACSHPWPCPDVALDFTVLGIEADDD